MPKVLSFGELLHIYFNTDNQIDKDNIRVWLQIKLLEEKNGQVDKN
jgi:hypothetical protein